FKYSMATRTFAIGAIVFVSLSIAVVILLPVALNHVPLPGDTDLIRKHRQMVLYPRIDHIGVGGAHRFGPSRSEPRWRWITWGSTCAAVIWLQLVVRCEPWQLQ